MKKTVTFIIAVLTIIFSVNTVFAAQVKRTIDSVSFSVDDTYTVKTDKELPSSLNTEGLLFTAFTTDGKHQFQCRRTSTAFSKELGTFSGLDSNSLDPVGNTLLPDGHEVTTIGSTVYLKGIVRNGDEFTAIYVTVSDGKLYSFTYFGEDTSRMGEFMSTVRLPVENQKSSAKTVTIILIIIFIIACAVLAGFIITSFVKDYRRHKMAEEENIVSQYIKIKRRKY